MATIQDRTYSAEYSGLLSNIYVSAVVAALCSLGFESFRRIRRRRGDPRKANEPRDDASKESWEFGYLYQARCWSRTPSPPLSPYPFAWFWAAIWFPEPDMPLRCGVDATVHVRYLRACFFYVGFLTLTVLPVLMPLHISYSPSTISNTSMVKASLSSLILTDKGRKYLWVHLVILIWILGSWVVALVWLSWGSIRYRRSTLHHTLDQAMKAASIEPPSRTPASTVPSSSSNPSTSPPSPSPSPSPSPFPPSHPPRTLTSLSIQTRYTPDQKPITNEGPRGWRQRSVIVTNIPPSMRTEETLRAYFEDGCNRYGILGDKKHSGKEILGVGAGFLGGGAEGAGVGAGACIQGEEEEDGEEPFITEVVVIRRMLELEKLRERRMDVLKRLELAHVVLVTKVMEAVRREKDRRVWRETGKNPGRGAFGVLTGWRRRKEVKEEEKGEQGERYELELGGDLEKGKKGRQPRASCSKEEGESQVGEAREEPGRDLDVSGMSKRERRELFFKVLGRFLDETGEEEDERTIWEMLHTLPRALLDPYQPLTHLTSLFRNQNAPLIDYLSAKLNLLTSLIEEQTSRPVSSFTPSSTAFVTFRNPKIARLVKKRMESHPRKRLACDVAAAPDFRDLDWVRLMRNTYRTEFVRGWVVAVGVWAFTVIWIIPISFFVTLTSIANIAAIFPPIRGYLERNPKTAATLTSLVPTLLVSILTLLIPLLLLIISKQAETITTKSELHNVIGSRFYRFLQCNVVIFFCIGVTSLQSFILQFQNAFLTSELLEVIASSFPQAAPFYAGWLILQTSLTSFFENFMLGLPLLFYLGIRASKVPRQRDQGMEPRFWNYFYWLPVHIVTLGIVVLFAILNPLVLPFGLIYFAVAYPVFKNQLLHVYQHQYETNGTRPTIRFLRYTLDGHALAQIVFLAMMVILKQWVLTGLTVVLIIVTLLTKVLLTRAVKARFAALALEESEGLYAISRGRAPAIRRSPSQGAIDIQDDPSPDLQEGTSSDGHGGGGLEITEPPTAASGSASMGRFATWRMRAGEGFHPRFSYSTVPRRRDSVSLLPLRRKAVPFNAETSSVSSQSPFLSVPSRLIAPLLARFDNRWQQSVTDLHEPEEVSSAPRREEANFPPPLEDVHSQPGDHTQHIISKEDPLVQSRKSPVAWDDTPHDGRRYGFQPTYVDPLPLALWLPRHPLRTLDLEDTIELSRSLETSLGGSGRIGAWGPADLAEDDGVLVVEEPEDYYTAGDAQQQDTELDMLGGLRDSPGIIITDSPESEHPPRSPRGSPTSPKRSPSKSSSTSLKKQPRLNGTERINLAALMADPESGSDDDDFEEEEELQDELRPGASPPGDRTSTALGRSKTTILARPRPKGARPPRRHISITETSASGGRRVASIFSSPSFRHPSNSLASPSNAGEGTDGGVVGRNRSNSQVSVKDALLEEILAEEREARKQERKEEQELTEKEGSRLKRGGSTVLKALGVMN